MEEKKFSRLSQGLSVRTIFQAMSPVVLSPMKMKERTCRIQRSPLVFILLLLKEKRERTGGTIFKCVHIQRRMDRDVAGNNKNMKKRTKKAAAPPLSN